MGGLIVGLVMGSVGIVSLSEQARTVGNEWNAGYAQCRVDTFGRL